jgi:hypothetical protein
MKYLHSIPLLALAATLFAFLWFYLLASRRHILTTTSRPLLALCIVILFAALAVLTVRAVRTPEAIPHPADTARKFDLSVVLSVTGSKTEVSQVPFRVGSGSINLGCEEIRGSHVEYPLPEGAANATATAKWVNVDNLDGEDANASITGGVAIGTGHIRGRHRTLFLNCPGGGHGELVLTGQYELKKTLPTEPTILKSIGDITYRGQIFTVSLPSSLVQPIDVVVTATDAESRSVLKATVAPNENGTLTLKIISRGGPIPTSIRVDGQTLVIEV